MKFARIQVRREWPQAVCALVWEHQHLLFVSETWNIHVVMLDIGFQWKLGRRWQIRRISPCPFIPINPPKIISRHHLQHTPSTNTPASPGIRASIWGGPWSHQRAWRTSAPRKPCRTRLIGGGSPPGAASYENRGRIVPTVDTLHYLRKQGVSKWQPDSSRIFVINKSHYICLWLAGRQK